MVYFLQLVFVWNIVVIFSVCFFQFIVRGWIVINGSLHAIHKMTVKMGREMIAVEATRTNNRNMEIFSMSGNKMKILTKCIYTMHRVLLALLLLLLRLQWRGLHRVSGRWICRSVSHQVYPVSWSNFRKLFMLQVFSLFFTFKFKNAVLEVCI